MQEDIKKLVDFNKLRKSNDLGKKWADRLDIGVNFYLQYMIDLKKNYEKYKNKLEHKFRSQFSKDYRKMWYALEVEDILIRQYEPCIYKIALKFCKDESKMDEYISLGMRTVRQSVWQYRTHKFKASFFTFVYNGLFQRLRGFRSKQLKVLKGRKKFVVFNEADLKSGDGKNVFNLENRPEKEKPHVFEDEKIWYENMIKTVIDGSVLSSEEKVLINMYMQRNDEHPDWCQKFRNLYPKQDGKIMSRQGVHNKLREIQKKMWITYRRVQIKNIQSGVRFAI